MQLVTDEPLADAPFRRLHNLDNLPEDWFIAEEGEFALANDPPRAPKWLGEPSPPQTQRVLITGLSCMPGQLDLFEESEQ